MRRRVRRSGAGLLAGIAYVVWSEVAAGGPFLHTEAVNDYSHCPGWDRQIYASADVEGFSNALTAPPNPRG